jgi:hypothetical protein
MAAGSARGFRRARRPVVRWAPKKMIA